MSQKLNIYQKLNNFRVAVGAIRKDKTNPYHKSKYADINAVLAVITEPLSQAGLVDVDTTRIDENGNMYLITRIVNIDDPNEFIEILRNSTLGERRPIDDINAINCMIKNADIIITATLNNQINSNKST